MTSKRRLAAALFLLVSTAVALLVCEGLSRLVFDRVDYLSPRLVRDDVLGIRLPPRSGGHDEWGFRNPERPKTAEIVALGDSHTYGNCARMREAWPQVLGRLAGKTVYNLGMGGYGPNQYYHLLQTKALSLKPKTIVCGLYLGDDFDNAYRITYGLDRWSPFREGGLKEVDPDIWQKEVGGNLSFQKQLRIWLSENSVLYRLVVHGVFAKLKGNQQLKRAAELKSAAATLIVPEKNIEEAFLPKGVLRGLDQEQSSVREGMRLTARFLREMNTIALTNGIQFVVAVIPTKESVFARYLENSPNLFMGDVIRAVITNERKAREQLFMQLTEANVRFVEVLPSMEKAVERERLYTYGASDMHPNQNGYRVIAEAIHQAISRAPTP